MDEWEQEDYDPSTKRTIRTIDVRFRTDGQRWEDIKSIPVPVSGANQADLLLNAISIVRFLRTERGDRAEVRWNWQGSLQGHYL